MITLQRYDETCCYVKSLQPLMSNRVELLTKPLKQMMKSPGWGDSLMLLSDGL